MTPPRAGAVGRAEPTSEAPVATVAPTRDETSRLDPALLHCHIPSVSTCDEYRRPGQVEAESARRSCEAVGGHFGVGGCPVEGRIGYCTEEWGRKYAYRPLNIALAQTLLCTGGDWTVIDPMGVR